MLSLTVPIAVALAIAGVWAAGLAVGDRDEEAAAARAARAAVRAHDALAAGRTLPPPGENVLVKVVGRDGTVVASAGRERPEATVSFTSMPATVCADSCSAVATAPLLSSSRGPVVVHAFAPVPASGLPWAVAAVVAAALVGLVAWVTLRVGGLVLRPVAAMRDDMAGVDQADLNRRVRVPATGDEIQGLGRAVNTLADQVEQVIERERRFVSDASHDLRNPITGLVTRLEVALAAPEDEPGPTLRALLNDALRLNEIVNDLLELTRLDSGAEATINAIDLAGLVAEEVARDDRGIAVTTDLRPGAVVLASRIRLARVLGNLLANAARHAEHAHVTVSVVPPHAFLEVVDDGPGIDPAEAERVFERFVRLDDARRRDPGGSGLGLPIARQIARMYGGDLYAAEHEGGARFVLTLPLA